MSIPHILERAFELARSGRCADTSEISRKLKKEGFAQVDEHLSAPSVRRQLRDLCKEANHRPAGQI
jgi:hypothetical protein